MSKSGAGADATSPPSGTGFVAGLGEAFSLDLNSGQGNYSLPLTLPEGAAGWTPHLKLEYTHGAEQGPFGLGWSLPLRSIERRLDFGVPVEGVVERFLDGTAELVPLADGTYRTMLEAAFSRYERSGSGWIITERDGKRHELGLTAAGRIADPDHPERVQRWLLERSIDTSGNTITYSYAAYDGTAYLSEVRYAAYVVRFSYETRPDVYRNGRAGFMRLLSRRCSRIDLMLSDAQGEIPLRTWTPGYTQAPFSTASLLRSVQLKAHGSPANGTVDIVKAPITLDYTSFAPWSPLITWLSSAPDDPPPPPLTDPDVALLALDDAPLPGILFLVNGQQYYWPNEGNGQWGSPRPVRKVPILSSFDASSVQFLDVDGDGTADMLVGVGAAQLPGYYENEGEAGWGNFVAYPPHAKVSPPWQSGRVRLGDLDGDGLVDALYSSSVGPVSYLNKGASGWAEPTIVAHGAGDDFPDVDFTDRLVFMVDMTGDGLPDIVRVRSGRVEYWPNLGYGHYGSRVIMENSPRLSGISQRPDELLLLDVDGDGCADLVRVSVDGVELVINQAGQRFADPLTYPVVPPPIPETLRAVDMRGRGTPGVLWNSLRGNRMAYVYLDLNPTAPPYLLSKIANGTGLVSEIFYRPAIEDALRDAHAGNTWHTLFPFPLWVVAGTKETDAILGLVSETHYRYHYGYFDPRGRRFEGFQHVEKQEIGDESRPDTLTAFTFLMDQEHAPGNGPQHANLNRLLSRVEIYSLDGTPQQARPYHVEQSDYDVSVLDTAPDGRQHVFTFVHRSSKHYVERGDDERVEERTYEYDATGNVVREVVRGYGTRGGVNAPELQITTEMTYATNPARGIFDAVARVVKRDAQGKIVGEIRRYYDGQGYVGLPLGSVERHLMTREEHLVLSASDFNNHYAGMDAAALGYTQGNDADNVPAFFAPYNRYDYSAQGNIVGEKDPRGNITTFQYDSSGLHRTRRSDSLGTTTYTYDLTCSKPSHIVDPDGGVAEMRYDALGRLILAVIGDDTLANPTRRMNYDDEHLPNSMLVSYRISASERMETVQYYDGAGKEVQKRVSRQAGEVLVSGWIERNGWRQARAEYEQTTDTDLVFKIPVLAGRPARRMFYDGEGRPVRTVNYNGGVSTVTYAPFEITTFDADDNDSSPENQARGQYNTPRREQVDVWNQRIAVIDSNGGGQNVTVYYAIGLLGELLSCSDDTGVAVVYIYDLRGDRLRIQHRDAGERKLWYDSARNVVRTLDARGEDIHAEYNAQGRLSRLLHNGTEVEHYSYDDLSTGGLGRLTEVQYAGGRQQFRYNKRGQITHRAYHVDGHTAPYTLDYQYNDMGKQTAITYPDGTTVNYEYYLNGMVRSIPNYIEQIDYDALNLPIRVHFANGVKTEITYGTGTGRIQKQRTTGPRGQMYEDITYTYDLLQMLLGASDAAPGAQRTDAYTYDPLYQLTSASGNDPAGNYHLAYSYTNVRNLSRLDEVESAFAYTDATRPNRLTEIHKGAHPAFTVPYDANGNMTALPDRTFTFNFKNELARVQRSDGTIIRYDYDYQGNRVRKQVQARGDTDETIMLGNLVEVRNGQMTLFIVISATRFALVTQGRKRFIHTDPLGSASFFSDEAGLKITQIAYYPFGNVRRQQGGPAATQVFALHEFDDHAGLYFMGKRCYAPDIGRFIMPDPLYLYRPEEGAGDPRSLWLYTYVGNDPLDNVDPTGLSFWSVFGAIIGVIVGVILAATIVGAPLGIAILVSIGVVALVTVSYVVAANVDPSSGFGQFMRGFLIGLNAGLNAVFATAVFGPIIGVTVGVINFLAVFDGVAKNEVYQGILGWSNWFMPMSWVVTGVGLIFFVLSGLGHIIGYWIFGSNFFKITSIRMNWKTGTLFTVGGWIGNLAQSGGEATAFDMGNFAFVNIDAKRPLSVLIEHESGHTLNLGAFGSIFHLIGAIDEISAGDSAYAEQLAESHVPTGDEPPEDQSRPRIPMWT